MLFHKVDHLLNCLYDTDIGLKGCRIGSVGLWLFCEGFFLMVSFHDFTFSAGYVVNAVVMTAMML